MKNPYRFERVSFRKSVGTPVIGLKVADSACGASFRKSQRLLKLYCGRAFHGALSTKSSRVTSIPIFKVWLLSTLVSTSFSPYVHWSKVPGAPIPNPFGTIVPRVGFPLNALLNTMGGKPHGPCGLF